jgi:cell division septation protein DedD
MDVYDRLQPEDLKQMAVIVASFVYMAAQRDQMFPRKPIEKELPPPPLAEDDENASPVTNPAAADRPQQPKPAEQRPAEKRPPQATPTPTPRPR